MKHLPMVALTAAALGLAGACGSGVTPSSAPADAPSQAATAPSATQSSASPQVGSKKKAETKPQRKVKAGDAGNRARSGRQTVVVTRVIDGDTFEARGVGNGPVPRREVDVRMLEIDTVEEGSCGYQAATDKFASLLGERVTVERDQQLKDQSGRWLLYVWSGGTFVNHEMVATGYAEAVLYEPNDKYWDRINAADTSDTYTPWPPCHTPEPERKQTVQREDNDDPGRAYQFPPPPPDRDCGDVAASDFPVRPGDPHRFDADGDGIGCEGSAPAPPPEPEQQAGAYPVPPPPPDRDCSEISASNFEVRPGDPHRFDADGDGIGCES